MPCFYIYNRNYCLGLPIVFSSFLLLWMSFPFLDKRLLRLSITKNYWVNDHEDKKMPDVASFPVWKMASITWDLGFPWVIVRCERAAFGRELSSVLCGYAI